MTFLFDENVPLKIHEGFRAFGKPVLHASSQPGRGTPDEVLIPFAAERDFRLISLDTRILKTPHLLALILDQGLGAYFLKPKRRGRQDPWEMVEILVKQWRHLEADAASHEPPYTRTISARGIRSAK